MRLACIALLWTLASSGGAHADTYPGKPIRLLVPLAAASTGDLLARIVAERVARNLGQPIVVDNRPGAGGNIGAEALARAPADGYTLGLATIATHAINPSLYKTVPFDPTADFTPLTLLATAPCVLIVTPSLPARDVRGLIEWARAKGPSATFASGGNGNAQHLAGELFAMLAGVKLTHVPYKGAAQGVTAVSTGEVDLMFPNIPLAQPLVASGRLRALGVTSRRRLSSLPDVPPIAETLAEYEVIPWFGVAAPARLHPGIAKRLHGEFVAALSAAEVRERLLKQGFEIQTSTPDEFSAFIRSESAKWARVVRTSGATVD